MQPSPHQVELKLAGTVLSLETGRIARQATGAIVARAGDTVILATVVSAPGRPDLSFFPLTVEYREKLAAVGNIPGSHFRREGKITDAEVLKCRIIDRTIRSLFPDGYRSEVQLQISVLSAAPKADTTTLAILAGCAALHISPIPANGPAVGLRIVRHNDSWTPFPTRAQQSEGDIDFVVCTGPDGLVMVEGGADEVSREDCLSAMQQALDWGERLQKKIEELAAKVGNTKDTPTTPPEPPALPEAAHKELATALAHTVKAERAEAVNLAKANMREALNEDADRDAFDQAFAKAKYNIVREAILGEGKRLDGRKRDTIRPIWSETGWLPRPHGSAVFTRGETQALVTCSLGTDQDAQRLEDLDGQHLEHFLLHYNFPPYSVGEVRPLRGPGRREIGHGFLAHRGLQRLLPSFEEFPYTIRIESDISESNGSSSMATVCGGCLSMLHAGVPLKRSVAGIAMGLVSDGKRTAILSDILGDEDHLGDMDFKVIGTEKGITALQLDNKIGGLKFELLDQALVQAIKGISHILGEMAKTQSEPSPGMSKYAPHVTQLAIMPKSISVLVGPRGANIKAISAASNSRVTVNDDGLVRVYSPDKDSAKKATQLVGKSVGMVKNGGYYTGKVTGVKDFGCFVKINDVVEGLVPREELAEQRSESEEQNKLSSGDEVVVRVLGADDRGKLRLSIRGAVDIDPALIEF